MLKVYSVVARDNVDARMLVKAKSRQQALAYVARMGYEVGVPSSVEIIDAMNEGILVEDATRDAAETDSVVDRG